jgi:hypothetical protein
MFICRVIDFHLLCHLRSFAVSLTYQITSFVKKNRYQADGARFDSEAVDDGSSSQHMQQPTGKARPYIGKQVSFGDVTNSATDLRSMLRSPGTSLQRRSTFNNQGDSAYGLELIE